MATWADVKANALKLGIMLTDADVGNVPLLATDAYGNFIPGPARASPQLVVDLDGWTTLVGTADAGNSTSRNAACTRSRRPTRCASGHAFINDMAHIADAVRPA